MYLNEEEAALLARALNYFVENHTDEIGRKEDWLIRRFRAKINGEYLSGDLHAAAIEEECPECGKVFSSQALGNHLRWCDGSIKAKQCPYCKGMYRRMKGHLHACSKMRKRFKSFDKWWDAKERILKKMRY